MQVSSLCFHQGKQQHTLVLGQASNQVVTFLKVKGQGQVGISPPPPKSQKCEFYVSVY